MGQGHSVIFSRSCLEISQERSAELIENIKKLKEEEFQLYCLSHDHNHALRIIKEAGLTGQLDFLPRDDKLRDKIKSWSQDGFVVIIIGVVDQDLYVAASTKSFLVGAAWVPREADVIKYGVQAPTPTKMKAILNIITNQTGWFYKCSFNNPIPTKIVTLCSANTYGSSVDPSEKEVAEKFKSLLKDGNQNPVTKQALMCHLMAAIAHDPEFKEVQDWAVVPSSSPGPNEVMEELKEHVRYMMNGRKPDPIFIRHTAVSKSRYDQAQIRQQPTYCLKHFGSIMVNEKYKGKLKGRVVCLLDDYLTHGNMFETLRNLLVACGVQKIICVAIGKFLRTGEKVYNQKLFNITGDVYSGNYNAEYASSQCYDIEVDQDAKRSMVDLQPLMQSLI